MNDEDLFGFISLDDSKQAALDEIILERRGANRKMKACLLKDMLKR